jgi:NAD(P)-dependent dehydrogenase (short-subunit alcohol dehydrogenase family)
MITGPSSGIGRATAIEMGRLGFHVVAAARSEERTRPVIDQIQADGGSADYLHLDLTSLASAQGAAREFEDTGRRLDVLINNAGVGGTRGVTEDGFEIHFGVNHLGHFMLTHHLRRTFESRARIVVVSSEAHRGANGIDFNKVQERGNWLRSWSAYGVSKLANILFAKRLAELQPDWRTYSLHPGVVNTNIFPAGTGILFRNRLTPEEGARTSIWCATSPDLADQSGRYYSHQQEREPSAIARDDDLATELWRRSELWCGLQPQHHN